MDKKKHLLNELLKTSIINQGMFYTVNILTEYKKAISDPDTSVGKIASIIEKDPGLTSAALKTANSSFYGYSKSVNTVKQAISVLGYKTLERVLLTQAMNTSFLSQSLPFMNDLWKHSLTTAIAAHQISALKNPLLAEQAFIAGLLHDLGKFLLITFKKEGMESLFKELEKNTHQYTFVLEQDIFGIDHQEIGEFFAKQWLFPDNVSNTIRFHHSFTGNAGILPANNDNIAGKMPAFPVETDLSDIDREMISTIAIANNIAKAMEFGKSTSSLVECLPHSLYQNIDFKPDDFERIVYTTKNKFYELTSLMED